MKIFWKGILLTLNHLKTQNRIHLGIAFCQTQ